MNAIRTGDVISACKVIVGKLEGKRRLERIRYR
jgi:hypothetical protein